MAHQSLAEPIISIGHTSGTRYINTLRPTLL